MPRDPRVLLWDARDAAERVAAFVAGRSFEDYETEALLRPAVERQLTIIGEALARLRELDAERASRVTNISDIIGLRNILVHGYFVVDDRLIWDVVTTEIPQLIVELGSLLREGQS